MVQCYSTGDGNVSFHKGTLAPPGEYDWTLHPSAPLESTTDTANGSVQPFLHSLRQKVPILYNGHPYPPELPLPMGDLDLPCNTMLSAHTSPQPKWHLDRFSRLCADNQSVSILYNTLPVFPSKLPLPMSVSEPHLIRGTMGLPMSGTQMATGSFQPFLQGWQTDRATERPTEHTTQCDAA